MTEKPPLIEWRVDVNDPALRQMAERYWAFTLTERFNITWNEKKSVIAKSTGLTASQMANRLNSSSRLVGVIHEPGLPPLTIKTRGSFTNLLVTLDRHRWSIKRKNEEEQLAKAFDESFEKLKDRAPARLEDQSLTTVVCFLSDLYAIRNEVTSSSRRSDRYHPGRSVTYDMFRHTRSASPIHTIDIEQTKLLHRLYELRALDMRYAVFVPDIFLYRNALVEADDVAYNLVADYLRSSVLPQAQEYGDHIVMLARFSYLLNYIDSQLSMVNMDRPEYNNIAEVVNSFSLQPIGYGIHAVWRTVRDVHWAKAAYSLNKAKAESMLINKLSNYADKSIVIDKPYKATPDYLTTFNHVAAHILETDPLSILN